MTPTETALDLVIEQYLQLRRALGRAYGTEERTLASLQRFLVAAGRTELDQEHFAGWCHSHAGLTGNVRRNRQRMVRNFCLYRQRTEPHCFVPDINHFPQPCPHAAPVIFGPTEVANMLAAAKKLIPAPNSPLRPPVMRLAIVLLYTAGLRRGELLRLTLADADPVQGVLRIRESKFHKSRFVPLSRDAQRELRVYLRQRLAPPFSVSPETPLLCNCARGFRGYSGEGVKQRAKVSRNPGETASKIDHPWLCHTPSFRRRSSWSALHGNHRQDSPSTSRGRGEH